MKYFLIFFLALHQLSALAECPNQVIKVYPENRVLNGRSTIIIEGHLNGAKIVRNLNSKYPVYLKSYKSNFGKIELTVEKVIIGENGFCQTFLIPARELYSETKYQLVIDSLPNNQPLTTYNSLTKSREPILFKVLPSTQKDVSVHFKEVSVHKEIDNYRYGDGAKVGVVLKVEVNVNSEYFLEAKLFKPNSSYYKTIYLQSTDNQVFFGYNYCASPIRFLHEEYIVKLRAITFSGFESNEQELVLTKPKKPPYIEGTIGK